MEIPIARDLRCFGWNAVVTPVPRKGGSRSLHVLEHIAVIVIPRQAVRGRTAGAAEDWKPAQVLEFRGNIERHPIV
jgi:hypothetical protein